MHNADDFGSQKNVRISFTPREEGEWDVLRGVEELVCYLRLHFSQKWIIIIWCSFGWPLRRWGGNMEKRDLLLQVAHMYYGLGMTQEKIAKHLFFSRSRISHLLTEAEESGLVNFELRQQVSQNRFLHDFLCGQFRLQNAFVEDGSFFTENEHHESICKTAAEFLCSQLNENTVLSISRGRTAYGIIHNMKAVAPIPTMCVVQTEGMLLMDDPYLDQMDFVRRVAEIYSCQYEHLMLPYLFETAQLKQVMVSQSFNQARLDRQQDINLICTSVCSLQQWRRYFRDDEYDWLVALGAVGSILGNFYDIRGNFLDAPVQQRCVIPAISVLQNAQQLICVCVGNYKDSALLGVLRTGLVTTLVTNAQLVQSIRQMLLQTPGAPL